MKSEKQTPGQTPGEAMKPMPEEEKKSERNRQVRRYLGAVCLAGAGIIGLMAAGNSYANHQEAMLAREIAVELEAEGVDEQADALHAKADALIAERDDRLREELPDAAIAAGLGVMLVAGSSRRRQEEVPANEASQPDAGLDQRPPEQ